MHLPAPLRAAVGLVATAADQARHLPDRAIELPMLAVSTALQTSLRMQQRYAGLAARGDDVLNRRTASAAPPEWATFDDPVPVEQLRRAVFDQSDGSPAVSALTDLFGTSDPRVPVPTATAAITDDPAGRSDDATDESVTPGPSADATGPGSDPEDPAAPGRAGKADSADRSDRSGRSDRGSSKRDSTKRDSSKRDGKRTEDARAPREAGSITGPAETSAAKAAKGSRTKPREAKPRTSKDAVSKTGASKTVTQKPDTKKAGTQKRATPKNSTSKGTTSKGTTAKAGTSKTVPSKGTTPKQGVAPKGDATPNDDGTPKVAARRPPARSSAKPVRPPTGRQPSAFDLAGDD